MLYFVVPSWRDLMNWVCKPAIIHYDYCGQTSQVGAFLHSRHIIVSARLWTKCLYMYEYMLLFHACITMHYTNLCINILKALSMVPRTVYESTNYGGLVSIKNTTILRFPINSYGSGYTRVITSFTFHLFTQILFIIFLAFLVYVLINFQEQTAPRWLCSLLHFNLVVNFTAISEMLFLTPIFVSIFIVSP